MERNDGIIILLLIPTYNSIYIRILLYSIILVCAVYSSAWGEKKKKKESVKRKHGFGHLSVHAYKSPLNIFRRAFPRTYMAIL